MYLKNGNGKWIVEPPKKYNCPLLGQPLLKIKIFWSPIESKISKIQLLSLTLGASAHYDYHWLYDNLFPWDTVHNLAMLFQWTNSTLWSIRAVVCNHTCVPKSKSCHRATMIITRRTHCFHIRHMAKIIQKHLFSGKFQRYVAFYHNKKHLSALWKWQTKRHEAFVHLFQDNVSFTISKNATSFS